MPKPYYETELGKLYHGDCLEIMPMLEPVDLVLTDPPYNINLKPQRKKTESILNDNMSDKEFRIFLHKTFLRVSKILTKDSFLVVFCGWPTIPDFMEVTKEYFTIKSMPIWVKNNWGIGYYTRPQYEPSLLLLNGKPKPLTRPVSDVWDFKRNYRPIHSCEKPTFLFSFIIESFGNKTQTVFDPFLGSGTTAIACERLNRRWIGIEIAEKYCEIAAKRIEKENQQLKLF